MPRHARGEDTRTKILVTLERFHALGAHPSIGDLARALDISRTNVAHHLAALVDDGRLRVVSASTKRATRYEITG